jgi:hypothetical protein
MSALRLINETEVASGVTSVDITDVFSADFDIYKITSTTVCNTINSTGVRLRFINSSGSVVTANNNDSALLALYTYNPFGEGRSTNIDSFNAFFGTMDSSPEGASAVNYVFNPYSSSSYTFGLSQQFCVNNSNEFARKYISVLKQTASMTGFQASVGAESFGTGTVFRTYGLRVDS